MSPQKSITMSDVARRLSISTVSVSKALQNKEGISEELRSKILQTADAMGYRYNVSAQNMKTGRTQNLGILISERFVNDKESFYWNICNKINSLLAAHQYFGIIETVSRSDEQNGVLPMLLQFKKTDGIIVLGQFSSGYLNMIAAEEVPLILTDFHNDKPQYDTITTDNFYSAYVITNHLIDYGHRQIGFVGDINATSSILDRYLGFCKSMLEHHIEIVPDWNLTDRNEDGIIDLSVLPCSLPTAFVCNCDQTAYKLIKLLNENGLSVPNDISVTGFDNDIYATLSSPPLTTIKVDIQSMASASVDCILAKLKNSRFFYGRKVIPGEIVYRNSVKRIN